MMRRLYSIKVEQLRHLGGLSWIRWFGPYPADPELTVRIKLFLWEDRHIDCLRCFVFFSNYSPIKLIHLFVMPIRSGNKKSCSVCYLSDLIVCFVFMHVVPSCSLTVALKITIPDCQPISTGVTTTSCQRIFFLSFFPPAPEQTISHPGTHLRLYCPTYENIH